MKDEALAKYEQEREKYWEKELVGKSPKETAQIIAQYETLATKDPLTGLSNLIDFADRFKGFSDGAFRRGSHVFIAFLDFDDLKKVNDSQGHKAGDELLKRGTNLLRSAFRISDLLGRKQGDEFLAALEFESQNYGEDKVVSSLQRVVNNLAESGISVSIGLSEYKKGENLDEVIDRADRNMRVDKIQRKAGRDFNK